MGRDRLELTNFKHPKGRLTAIAYSHSDDTGQAVWNCMCECGAKRQMQAYFLKSGHILSCGCLARDRLTEKAKRYEAFGESKTMREWANDPRCSVRFSTLAERIRVGWSFEKAIATPPRSKTRQTKTGQREALSPCQRAIPFRELFTKGNSNDKFSSIDASISVINRTG
jgi:hypothetical protein